MGVPIGVSYTSTAKGARIKHVQCEQCQIEYVYHLEREVHGESTSWLFLDNDGARSEAQRRAARELAQQLYTQCDPVPCPSCGWYQQQMQDLLKKEHRRWMFYLGCVSLAACFFAALFIVSQVLSPLRNDQLVSKAAVVAIVSLLAGVGLIVSRARFGANYDPNRIPVDERRALAKDKAMLREEFDRLAEEEQKKADEEQRKIDNAVTSDENPLAFLDMIDRKRRRR